MTNKMTLFECMPPSPTQAAYRAWTLDEKEDVVAAAFQRRYGKPPEFIFESRGLLLVGPIPVTEAH